MNSSLIRILEKAYLDIIHVKLAPHIRKKIIFHSSFSAYCLHILNFVTSSKKDINKIILKGVNFILRTSQRVN